MASAENLELEIVTPSGVALRERVSDVTAPSVAGEFGVLPGHLPVLAALRTGLVTFHKDGTEHRYAVAHGFAEVAHDVALLLTDKFSSKEAVDVVKTRMRLKEVDEELDHWTGELTDPRRIELIEEEQWLATLLELIGDPPPPMVREDTRFLAKHAEPPTVEEEVDAARADESMVDDHGSIRP